MPTMKLKTHILWAALAVAALTAGCKSDDYGDGSTPLDNAAFIDAAEVSPDAAVVIRKDLGTFSREFSIKLVSPAPADSEIAFTVDEGAIGTYNRRHGTSYTLLPKTYYDLSETSVHIGAGKTISDPVTIVFKGLDAMELDKTYLFPVSITQTPGGIGLVKGSETVWFVVKRSSAITTAADLTDCYMWIPSYETPAGWAAIEGFKELTFECLVNIRDFTHKNPTGYEISVTSVMGVEQWMLMRVGDSNYPRQQIQMNIGGGYWPANGRDWIVPAITLDPGEWYHLAFTWNLAESLGRLYVNGKLAYETAASWEEDTFNLNLLKTGGVDDKGYRFFIGYSYDPDRPLYGLISEVRVWSKARTQEEIFRDMYKVENPETLPELRGYWKFDEGSGNEVIDHSQYHNNAKCLDGKNNFENKERNEGTLKWNTSVEIPVLNKVE